MTHALHLTTWHPCIDGSSGIFVIEQCQSLKAAGLEVGLIYSRIQGLRSLTKQRLFKGCPRFTSQKVPFPAFGFKSWNAPMMNRLIPKIHKAVLMNRFNIYSSKIGKPDVLHAHVALESGIAANYIASKTGVNYVITEHSSEILKRYIDTDRQNLARMIYSDAKCVIAVSSALADRILDICPHANVKVIGNVVREHVFSAKVQSSANSSKIGVVSIGSLIPAKRIHNSIKALALLPDELKGRVEYHIIGEGPDRQFLENLAALSGIRYVFHGNLIHEDVIKVLAQSDLLLHPSAYETFGIVIAEAVALGLPAIATRCGGPEDIITNDNGILVPVDDVPALADAIQSISEKIQDWRRASEVISENARMKYHEDQFVKSIIEIYRSC